MCALKKINTRKSVAGIFMTCCGMSMIIREYISNEANYALITQAIGLVVLGVGLFIGKSL